MHGGSRSRIVPAAQEAYYRNRLCSIHIYFLFSVRTPCAPWSTALAPDCPYRAFGLMYDSTNQNRGI